MFFLNGFKLVAVAINLMLMGYLMFWVICNEDDIYKTLMGFACNNNKEILHLFSKYANMAVTVVVVCMSLCNVTAHSMQVLRIP